MFALPGQTIVTRRGRRTVVGTGAGAAAGDALKDALDALQTAGKLVSAWFLPSDTPDQYLTRTGSNVLAWTASHGTHKINLNGQNAPQWSPSSFGGKGAVTSAGAAYLLGASGPVGWPTTGTSYVLLALRNDGGIDTGIMIWGRESNGTYRAIATGSSNTALRGRIASTAFQGAAGTGDGSFTAGLKIVIGGTTALYRNGSSVASAATSIGSLGGTDLSFGYEGTTGAFSSGLAGAFAAMVVLNGTASDSDFLALEALMRARLA